MRIKLNESSIEYIHGFCERCKNYTNILRDMDICINCENEYEKRRIKEAAKSYIKVGSRENVGL